MIKLHTIFYGQNERGGLGMNCKEAVSSIHEYLDGTLDPNGQSTLDHHLAICKSCREHLKQLEMTEAHIHLLKRLDDTPENPPNLTERIMSSLPAPQKRRLIAGWLKRHPALAVSVLFLVVMFSSLATLWDTNDELTITTSEFDKLVIEGKTVIVPEDQTIQGDLIVENGEIIVEGMVEGDLVIIDGRYTASTANISGRITIVNRMFDWLWYKIAGLFRTV